MPVVYASDNELRFIGSVTASTCDVIVWNGAVPNNNIYLGNVPPFSISDERWVFFNLKPDLSMEGCRNLSDNIIRVHWVGPLNDAYGIGGLSNISGSADEAIMILAAANAATDNGESVINSNFTYADHEGGVFMLEGAKYGAQLIGGQSGQTGTFISSASFFLSYN
ncbi:hypothetical protein IMB69_003965, partial [Salmonella enterica]|nr:hypothetical protein [Salmonella enterica]